MQVTATKLVSLFIRQGRHNAGFQFYQLLMDMPWTRKPDHLSEINLQLSLGHLIIFQRLTYNYHWDTWSGILASVALKAFSVRSYLHNYKVTWARGDWRYVLSMLALQTINLKGVVLRLHLYNQAHNSSVLHRLILSFVLLTYFQDDFYTYSGNYSS